ncbi:putative malate dehydrogenase 1B isoform X2 [Pangasianodon hypophthalmus]|uniref:putative malate dehydrogenase 1B isoform X2 n=1 Tax=Pangasianodon hypophthalmus TaxID=310915 RepID=UPI002307E77F|nr:putative malate dehydrogenase 1B isoform X2 [Pangasianodon hypophthalmus]
MAKFVLAGKADCPYYAKAELLADLLQSILPDFHIHKLCMLPDAWESWLQDTCSRNGWKHESSPMVWRELTDRGGKGVLLGGFSDFLEYVQGYYGITSDMGTELMLNIAAENLQAAQLHLQDEERRSKLHQSFHIWISSALNPICYHLVPLLFTSGVFAAVPTVSLHLLDVDASEDSLSALKMDVEDMALPRLRRVTAHSDPRQAFQSADLIIFLDDQGANEDAEQRLSQVVQRFTHYGCLIEDDAHKELRVLVAGDVYVNLKCGLLIENAPSVDPRRFVVIAAQLEGEARTQLAIQLSVKSQDITDVIVWGNISGHFHIDLQRAKVYSYKGAIWGPAGFSQSVLEMVYDRKWLKNDFPSLVGSRRSAISQMTNRPAAISATRGIVTALNAWINDSSPQEIFSVGVVSTGHFGVPAGLVFCVPVTFQEGEWSVCSDVIIPEELRRKLEAAVNEITEVKKRKNKQTKKKTTQSSLVILIIHMFSTSSCVFCVHFIACRKRPWQME